MQNLRLGQKLATAFVLLLLLLLAVGGLAGYTMMQATDALHGLDTDAAREVATQLTQATRTLILVLMMGVFLCALTSALVVRSVVRPMSILAQAMAARTEILAATLARIEKECSSGDAAQAREDAAALRELTETFAAML
jgi:uncharacterized membrane protein